MKRILQAWRAALPPTARRQCSRRYVQREAVQCYERALQTLQHLPQPHDTREQAVDLHLELRNTLVPLGEFARILAQMRTAEALAKELGDDRRQGGIAAYLTRDFQMIGNYAQALASGLQALTMVQEDVALDDPGTGPPKPASLTPYHAEGGQEVGKL